MPGIFRRRSSRHTGRWLTGVLATLVCSMPLADSPPAAPTMDAYPDPRIDLVDRCWTTTFIDEFDALSLHDDDTNQGNWTPEYLWGNDIVINEELQYYTHPTEDDAGTIRIDDGFLTLSARPTPPALRKAAGGRPYVSGLLTSAKGFSQYHGRFDIRARVPAGNGLWSAFWLLPTFAQWPDGIDILHEIDVMEHLGESPSTYHTTLHTNQAGVLDSYPDDHTLEAPLTDAFHLYSVVWNARGVHWYLDRRWMSSEATPADYDQPMHMLVNLAVGGTWPVDPDQTTGFPARYVIDKIQVWHANGEC